MILGIMGKAQHGKDTLGKMLADGFYEITHKKYVLMAYGTELKRKVQADFDLNYEQLWGNGKETPDPRFPKPIRAETDYQKYWTPREILQNYGQFYRTVFPDFWVRALFDVIEDKKYENVIITDARHINEVKAVKSRKGFVIKIVRNIETGVHNQNHISETALDKYKADFVIKNYGSLPDLRKSSDELVKALVNFTKDIKIIGGKNGEEQRFEF